MAVVESATAFVESEPNGRFVRGQDDRITSLLYTEI